jgi:hypothetical protein
MATLDLASSRIIKIAISHNHTLNLLKESARDEENKLIMAATVGNCKRSEVINRVKTNTLQSALPEAQAELRKSHALGQAIQC